MRNFHDDNNFFDDFFGNFLTSKIGKAWIAGMVVSILGSIAMVIGFFWLFKYAIDTFAG